MHFSCDKSRRQLLQATLKTTTKEDREEIVEPTWSLAAAKESSILCYLLKLVFSYIYLYLCILDYTILTKEAFLFQFHFVLKPLNVNAAVMSVL